MNKLFFFIFILTLLISILSFQEKTIDNSLKRNFFSNLEELKKAEQHLLHQIKKSDTSDNEFKSEIISSIEACRNKLKAIDFWLRYIEPVLYKLINGPLPVEWETEVFEKYEKPYRRVGTGLTIAEIYLQEDTFEKDSLISLIEIAIAATANYNADSLTNNLNTPDAFFLCNRLYLLNLATIYSTGFECPDSGRIIPELENMLESNTKIYEAYNASFPDKLLSEAYQNLYNATINFVKNQPKEYSLFDHFTFIKNYINPLFGLNQEFLRSYKIVTKSNLDYSIRNKANSIFDKSLYFAQNTKGVFTNVTDNDVLKEIDSIGKLLFYDPLLSGNNQRSCASCHKTNDFFTDTSSSTSLQFDRQFVLERNTPSLINVPSNHLIMLDGKMLTLLQQGKTVITNPLEMGGNEKEVVAKVMSCKTYANTFKKLLKYTPEEDRISLNHIVSAITFYYGKFSNYYAPFDDAMNENKLLNNDAKEGFNLFMSKAQCATCHFAPTFSGIKPPFIGNEFEVIGIPFDTTYKHLSNDKGRFHVNPALETLNAFRTTTLRNTANTKPYMHNGIFKTLDEVIDFYGNGGGIGHQLEVNNQTLSSDSLKLSKIEKQKIIMFIESLNENVIFENPPQHLPISKIKKLNTRQVGGIY